MPITTMPMTARISQLTSQPNHVLRALLSEVGEDADQRALEHDVRHRRERTGDHAPHLAETLGDEAVERAGRRDVARHLDEPDGEQREHDGGDEEAGRSTDAVAVADRERRVAGHRGDRGGVGDGDEQHAHQADGAGLELVRRLGAWDRRVLELLGGEVLASGHGVQSPSGRRSPASAWPESRARNVSSPKRPRNGPITPMPTLAANPHLRGWGVT